MSSAMAALGVDMTHLSRALARQLGWLEGHTPWPEGVLARWDEDRPYYEGSIRVDTEDWCPAAADIPCGLRPRQAWPDLRDEATSAVLMRRFVESGGFVERDAGQWVAGYRWGEGTMEGRVRAVERHLYLGVAVARAWLHR